METKKQKTICLCAIVKNEGKVIGRLIDSCIGIIDYWVIYDTGSTDDTMKIIKEKLKDVPGELHESPFVNFGHNRTEVVKTAKGKADYLLLMDADMTVHVSEKFDKSKLDADMYHIRYTGGLDFAQPLLVSGKFDWAYIGVTHEYIHCKDAKVLVDFREMSVTHHFDGGTRSDKLERDARLLEKAILEDPGDTRNYFYLAQTYGNMNKFEQAIKYYEQRVNRGGWQEEVYYSKYQIGVMYHHMKQIDRAVTAYLEAYNYRPIRYEALYMLGVLFREMQKYPIAKLYFEAVKNMDYPKNDVLFVHKNHQEYLVDFELAICYYYLGWYEKAEILARKVETMKVDMPESVRRQNKENLRFILEKQGKIPTEQEDFMVVSMFTAGTPYEDEIQNLKKGLDFHNLRYELVGVKPVGAWEKNTQLKPVVIDAVLKKYKRPVLWIDADATIHGNIDFFKKVKEDISFYKINEWNEMLTGTLYFKYNPKVLSFLAEWINLNNTNDLPDAKNFQTVMQGNKDLSVLPMPPEYIKIFDNDLIKADNPVIMHHQASRRLKDKVNIKREDIIKNFFSNYINGQKSISIIGNGPFKTDLSAKIDNSFVLRCNNFKIGDEYKEIGSKIDVNISSLYYEIIPNEKVEYPIFGVLPISDSLYQKYTTSPVMHKYWLENAKKLQTMNNRVYVYDDQDKFSNVFTEVAEKINAFPTVGIMAIAAARWLGFKEIIISGFTFFDKSEKSHYFTDKDTRPSLHHNVEAERKLLKQWIQDDDIEYVLDEITELKIKEDD